MSPEDEVTAVMDLGGREPALLAHLLMDGALQLLDRVLVHWHIQHLVRSNCATGKNITVVGSHH